MYQNEKTDKSSVCTEMSPPSIAALSAIRQSREGVGMSVPQTGNVIKQEVNRE